MRSATVPSPSGTLKSAATTLRGSEASATTGTTAEAVAERSRTVPPARHPELVEVVGVGPQRRRAPPGRPAPAPRPPPHRGRRGPGRPPGGASSGRPGRRGARRGRPARPAGPAGRGGAVVGRPRWPADGAESGGRGLGQPGPGRCPLALHRLHPGHGDRVERGRAPAADGHRPGRQRGHHAVGGAVRVEHGPGDAPVGRGQPLDLVPHVPDRVEAQVGAEVDGQLGGDHPVRPGLARRHQLLAQPADPALEVGGGARPLVGLGGGEHHVGVLGDRPGAVATATTNSAPVEAPAAASRRSGKSASGSAPSSTSDPTAAPSAWPRRPPRPGCRRCPAPGLGAPSPRPGRTSPGPLEGHPAGQDARGQAHVQGAEHVAPAEGRQEAGARAGPGPAAWAASATSSPSSASDGRPTITTTSPAPASRRARSRASGSAARRGTAPAGSTRARTRSVASPGP